MTRPGLWWPGWLCICVGGLLAGAANAQGIPCLRSSRYAVPAGQHVTLSVAEVDGAQIRAAGWPAAVPWMFVRDGGSQQNMHTPRPRVGRTNGVAVTLKTAGVALIGLDQAPRVEQMTPERFEAFLTQRVSAAEKERLLVRGRHVAPRRLNVRWISSGKVLVRVQTPNGADPGPSEIAVSKTGQQVELRALMDPTCVPPGSDLAVRAYVRGSKVASAVVHATNETTGSTLTATTDANGIANLSLPAAGVWRVAFCHIERGNTAADWVVYSATLMFEMQAGQGRGR